MGYAATLFYNADPEVSSLHRRIVPSDEQYEEQVERWNALADWLIERLAQDSDLSTDTKLQGSYQYGTQISLGTHLSIEAASIPPKEYYFEKEIISRLKLVSYQDPDRVTEGLSYIWSEPHKWQKIATALTLDEPTARKTLRLIVDRRNSIVHEADIDLSAGMKHLITSTDAADASSYIERCGEVITNLVI